MNDRTFIAWRRYVAQQESRALRAFVKAGRWPRCTTTDWGRHQ